MSTKKQTELALQAKNNITNTLHSLANAIESGEIVNYEINHNSSGLITVKVDSSDGEQRMIQTQSGKDGYKRNTTEYVIRKDVNSRRDIVLDLVKDNMTQEEIADRTMVSQKTISNDIKVLKLRGKL